VCGRCAVGFWLGGVKEVREVGGGGGRLRSTLDLRSEEGGDRGEEVRSI
jgi:hypothetical protein